MLKWQDFSKKIAAFFSGNKPAGKSGVAPQVSQKQPSFSVRARVFLLNYFFADKNNEDRKTQSRIYAQEGDLAYQKAKRMEEAVQAADSLYQKYKEAKAAALASVMQAKLTSLIKFIKKNFPSLDVSAGKSEAQKKYDNEHIDKAMTAYFQARAEFELKPENKDKVYSEPYISPDTAYAAMSSSYNKGTLRLRPGHQRTASLSVMPTTPNVPADGESSPSASNNSNNTPTKIPMPTFSNTIGWSILNPFYGIAMLLNGVSKVCEYPAQGICWGFNKMFGEKEKNSTMAIGLKGVVAGGPIVARSVIFAIAKVMSPDGLQETWEAVRRHSQHAVADIPIEPLSARRRTLPGFVVDRSRSQSHLVVMPVGHRRSPSEDGGALPASDAAVYSALMVQQKKMLPPSPRRQRPHLLSAQSSVGDSGSDSSRRVDVDVSVSFVVPGNNLLSPVSLTPKPANDPQHRTIKIHRHAASDGFFRATRVLLPPAITGVNPSIDEIAATTNPDVQPVASSARPPLQVVIMPSATGEITMLRKTW